MRFYFLLISFSFLCSCTLKKGNKSIPIESQLQGQWRLINTEEVFQIPFIENVNLLQINHEQYLFN